jgi:predicted metal-dependent hydrolase
VIEPEYAAFVECWNGRRFFEAHEVLEGLWMRTRDRGQQGLIQMAAALYHIQRRNLKGARTMLDRALPRLRDPAIAHGPIDFDLMIQFAERTRETLTESNGEELIASRPQL